MCVSLIFAIGLFRLTTLANVSCIGFNSQALTKALIYRFFVSLGLQFISTKRIRILLFLVAPLLSYMHTDYTCRNSAYRMQTTMVDELRMSLVFSIVDWPSTVLVSDYNATSSKRYYHQTSENQSSSNSKNSTFPLFPFLPFFFDDTHTRTNTNTHTSHEVRSFRWIPL